MARDDIADPVINSPFDPPERHFTIGPNGPTGEIKEGRRPSESFIPVPQQKGRGSRTSSSRSTSIATGDRIEENDLINDIRRHVERWRASNWNGVTPYTASCCCTGPPLPPVRDDPVLFCQREAVETAIFLAEVAGRHGTAGLPRASARTEHAAQRRPSPGRV